MVNLFVGPSTILGLCRSYTSFIGSNGWSRLVGLAMQKLEEEGDLGR
jgi:hypothetical protein